MTARPVARSHHTKGFSHDGHDLVAHARAIIDATLYLTLGTVDPSGRPWTSPVYFASDGDRNFYWLSATDAQHSRHPAERPQVSIVIFDSTVVPYHGRAVYAAHRGRKRADAWCPVGAMEGCAVWQLSPAS